jgi:hypothetical protein
LSRPCKNAHLFLMLASVLPEKMLQFEPIEGRALNMFPAKDYLPPRSIPND